MPQVNSSEDPMPTASISIYQGLIDKKVKQMACSSEWYSIKKCLDDTEPMLLFSLINSAPVENITILMKNHNVPYKLLNLYLIYSFSILTEYYIEATELTYRKRRRHTDLVQALYVNAQNAQTMLSKDENWRSSTAAHIFNLIALMQDGILRMQCNLHGNFANMCRAIVSRAIGEPEWDFDPFFLRKLGMEPSPGASIVPRVACREILIENCSIKSQVDFTVEDMAVAIATKKASRVARGLVFNCLVLKRKDNIDELAELLTDLRIKATEKPSKNFRLQVLYKTIDHWSTLDISFHAGQFSVYFVDTANSLSIIIDAMVLLVAKLPGSLFYYTGGPFQFDGVNCAIFAFDHACCLARIPDLHKRLAQFEINPSIGGYKNFVDYIDELINFRSIDVKVLLEIGPFLRTIKDGSIKTKIINAIKQLTYISAHKLNGDLAPLIRNIQSFTSLRFYLDSSSSLASSRGGYRDTLTLTQKIEEHTRLFDGSKSRNFSADDKRTSVKNKTKTFLLLLSQENCSQLLFQRKILPVDSLDSDDTCMGNIHKF